MAHVQKNTIVATGHLFNHYGRNAEDEKYKYLYRSNDSIDPERTHLNYNLAPSDKTQGERLNERLSQVKVLKRKDVNVMCSWVVTAPKDLPVEQEKEFFKETYNFLSNRYGGEKNVISAYVHKDETTPHMHFAFVPVTIDKKKGIEKVSAKEVLTKLELKSFHTDLENHLKSKGIKCSILNEATREGNKSVAELKRNTAMETVNKLNKDINTLKTQLNALQGQLVAQKDIIKIDPKKTLTGAIKGVTVEQIQDLKQTAIEYYNLKSKFNEVSKRLKRLESDMLNGVNEKIEFSKIKSENQKLRGFIESKGLAPELFKYSVNKNKKVDLER